MMGEDIDSEETLSWKWADPKYNVLISSALSLQSALQ